MHDLILAKQIINEITRVAKDRGIGKIKKVTLGIGAVALAHDGFPEHADEIDPGNLKFLLESLAQNSGLDEALFEIEKTSGCNWKILEIESI